MKDIIALQKILRDTLYVRPFDIDAIESAGIKLCDAVVDNAQFATDAGVWKDYRWFIETSFNGYTPIKMALQELSDGTINESECTEVIANAYKNATTPRSEVDLNEIKNKAIAKAKREYETGKIGFVQALEQVYQAKAPSTHSSSEMVQKYRQALSRIRRVEMLTPETEAMINKLLNL